MTFIAGVAFGAAYLALDLPGAFRRQAQSPDAAPLSAFASSGATRNPDASASPSARVRRLLTARSAPSAPLAIPDRAALVSAPAPSPPDVLFGHCRAEEARGTPSRAWMPPGASRFADPPRTRSVAWRATRSTTASCSFP